MADATKKTPQVRIGHNDMEAFLFLPVPNEKYHTYSLRDLEYALADKGVKYGIHIDVLERIADQNLYGQEILVAEGVPAQDGADGYYEYFFNMNPDGKPKILEDGSVDYWSIKKVETVVEDQIIAVYHPAIMGKDGMSVKGKPIQPKRSRELPPLKGRGFTRSEDNLTYTANFDGKIEMKNDRITVSQVYEIMGDADLSVGNIDFRGDVLIHGNVCTGIRIKAAGSITVDGLVEHAQLWAGGDIILRGGMMGDSTSTIFSKGNITARFFEYTDVEAEGDITACVFMNCTVRCKKSIILSGKKSGIVGGKVHAIQGIECDSIGNDVEIHTEVSVGNGLDILRKIRVLQKSIFDMKDMLEKIDKGLQKFELLEAENVVKKDDPRKVQLLRVKIRDSAVLSEKQAELERLELQVQAARGCNIRVKQNIYPGVMIVIDDLKLIIRAEASHVEYRKDKGEIRSYTSF